MKKKVNEAKEKVDKIKEKAKKIQSIVKNQGYDYGLDKDFGEVVVEVLNMKNPNLLNILSAVKKLPLPKQSADLPQRLAIALFLVK